MLIRLPRQTYAIGDRFHNLLMSDLHLGSSSFDEKSFMDDLAWAREAKARIMIAGDVFDLILPSDSQRYNPSAVHPDLRGSPTPMNDLIPYAAEKLSSVVNLIDMIGVGNHDVAGIKYHNADPVAMLLERLNGIRTAKHPIAHGAYTGAVVQTFRRTTGAGASWNTYYHHGYGGESPSTRGILNLNRLSQFVDRADVVWMGHKHHRYVIDDRVTVIPPYGQKLISKQRWLVQSASYRKPAMDDQMDSKKRYTPQYEVQGGMIPKPNGGIRFLLTMANNAEISSQVLL